MFEFRVQIIHMSKFKPGRVEKKSSFIKCVGSIPAEGSTVVENFYSTVLGLSFCMCIISS